MTKYPTVLIPVCPDLEHLSEEGLRQMAKDYLIGIYSIPKLMDIYNVKVAKPAQLGLYFPPFPHFECVCPSCLVVSWILLTDVPNPNPFCPICGEWLSSHNKSFDYYTSKNIR